MPGFPPYSDEILQYYLWGVRKGFLMPEVQVPEIEIPKEAQNAFDQGLREGENYGVNGFPIDNVCVDLRETPTSTPKAAVEVADSLLELWGIGHSLIHARIIGAGVEFGLLVIMVSIAVTEHFRLPTTELDQTDYRSLLDFLTQVEEPFSLDLFMGGGIDYESPGCELQVTRVYKYVDACRKEMQDMGRPASILLSLSTNMSGGAHIIEQNGDIIN
jgi:hypothetical protein